MVEIRLFRRFIWEMSADMLVDSAVNDKGEVAIFLPPTGKKISAAVLADDGLTLTFFDGSKFLCRMGPVTTRRAPAAPSLLFVEAHKDGRSETTELLPDGLMRWRVQ
jgi:hypothetical protein